MCAAQSGQECLLACGAVVITGASSGIGEEFVKVITTLNSKAKFFNLSRTAPDDSLTAGQLEHCPADLSSAAGQEVAITAVEHGWMERVGMEASFSSTIVALVPSDFSPSPRWNAACK